MEIMYLFGFLGVVSLVGIIWGSRIILNGGIKDE